MCFVNFSINLVTERLFYCLSLRKSNRILYGSNKSLSLLTLLRLNLVFIFASFVHLKTLILHFLGHKHSQLDEKYTGISFKSNKKVVGFKITKVDPASKFNLKTLKNKPCDLIFISFMNYSCLLIPTIYIA